MRWFVVALMLSCTFAIGCDEPDEMIPTITPSSGTTGDGTTGSSGTTGSEMSMGGSASEMGKVRFVADKSIRVDNMMCPYSCWPKVKETLEGQPGVENVQLAQQPEGTDEGTIALPVVELKLSGDFDSSKALSALEKIDFAGEVVK